MPAFPEPALGADALEDLVAYLAAQKGEAQ